MKKKKAKHRNVVHFDEFLHQICPVLACSFYFPFIPRNTKNYDV